MALSSAVALRPMLVLAIRPATLVALLTTSTTALVRFVRGFMPIIEVRSFAALLIVFSVF